MSNCPRVQQRIECDECGYPAGEALYYLVGHKHPVAYNPMTKERIHDPGHVNDYDPSLPPWLQEEFLIPVESDKDYDKHRSGADYYAWLRTL